MIWKYLSTLATPSFLSADLAFLAINCHSSSLAS
jgi:hypothetical protein